MSVQSSRAKQVFALVSVAALVAMGKSPERPPSATVATAAPDHGAVASPDTRSRGLAATQSPRQPAL